MNTIFFTIDDISGRGGTERVVANLANAFAPTHSIVIITYHLRFESISVNLPKNTKIINLSEIHGNFEPKGTFGKFKLCYYINQIIRANGSDKNALIANCNVFYPFFKRRDTRYARLEHYNFRFLHRKYVDKKPFMPRIALFDALVVLSSNELSLWQKLNSHIKVIPNFLPQIPQKSTDYPQKVVLSAGRFSSEKGFLRLIDIWKIVQEMINNPSLRKSADTSSLRDSASAESWQSTPCHTEHSEVSQKSTNRDSSLTAFAQNDNNIDCHENPNEFSRNDKSDLCGSIVSEKSGLRSHERGDRTDSSSTKRVASLPDLSPQDNAHWKLIIVGDGVLKSEIESKINALNLQDSIIIKPFTKEIEREYLGASIYAMASHFEGFPMVLVEASSYGLPCIAFDIATGPSDIIAHKQSGYLVSDNDLEGYAKHLIALMSDENLRMRFGAEAKKLVSERFSKEAIMEKWEELLEVK